MSDWKQIPIGKIGSVVSGGTPQTVNTKYWGDDFVWLTPNDLSHEQKYYADSPKKITR